MAVLQNLLPGKKVTGALFSRAGHAATFSV